MQRQKLGRATEGKITIHETGKNVIKMEKPKDWNEFQELKVKIRKESSCSSIDEFPQSNNKIVDLSRNRNSSQKVSSAIIVPKPIVANIAGEILFSKAKQTNYLDPKTRSSQRVK